MSIQPNSIGEFQLIHLICGKGDLSAIEVLLQNGVDVNTVDSIVTKMTALMYAVIQDRLPLIQLLLQWNADVNRMDAKYGMSAIHFAVEKKVSIDCLKLLTQHGANIHQKCRRGKTALHYACYKGNSSLDYINFLIQHKANINARDCYGQTCLIMILDSYLSDAVVTPLVELLLYHHANLFCQDGDHRTAFTVAKRTNKVRCLTLLERKQLSLRYQTYLFLLLRINASDIESQNCQIER
jgi:ankyrin repeat protein